MNKDKLNLLKQVLYVQTSSYKTRRMRRFVRQFCHENGIECLTKDGNMYLTKGEADVYPCIVAHTDTVHAITDHFTIYETVNGNLFAYDSKVMKPTGIGGDDKVGVFLALQLMLDNEAVKVALFKDEEVGCQGSAVADMSFFKDVNFVMQGDRKGSEDVVNKISGIELFNSSFEAVISHLLTKYNRKVCSGGMTDVMQLAENGLAVPCLNMSCGYYNPHTDTEYVNKTDVMLTLDFMQEIINVMHGVNMPLTEAEIDKRKNRYNSNFGRNWGWDDWSYGEYGWGTARTGNDWSRRGRYNNFNGTPKKLPQRSDTDKPVEVNGNKDDKPVQRLESFNYNRPEKQCARCGGINMTADPMFYKYYCYDCQDYTTKNQDWC